MINCTPRNQLNRWNFRTVMIKGKIDYRLQKYYIFSYCKNLNYLRSETNFGNRKPFKNDEKCFLFHFKKLLLFSRYLNFCLDFLIACKTAWFEITWKRNAKIISKQPGERTITIHILPNISRRNIILEINIFLEKPCTKYVRETIPRLQNISMAKRA